MFPSNLLAWLAISICQSPPNLEPVITEALKAWQVPGAYVVVVGPDRVLLSKGFGRRNNDLPVDDNTVFPIASCTKAFTAAILAKSVAKQKLHWDDPVRQHLPGFSLSDPEANRLVTVRDLLSHRTGLEGHDLLWYRSPLSQEELVKRASFLPFNKPFRTTMQYQSIMYMAAGQISEKVNGQSWGELVRNEILKPLGMKKTAVQSSEIPGIGNIAQGYRLDRGKRVAVAPYDHRTANPAGSLAMCGPDLIPWLQFQLLQGRYGDQQLIPKETFRTMHESQIAVPLEGEPKALSPTATRIGYGLGWVVQDYRGHALIGHTGLIDGFRAQILLFPDDGLRIGILANLEGTRMNLALGYSIADRLLKLPDRDWNEYYRGVVAELEKAESDRNEQRDRGRRPDIRPSFGLEQYTGVYQEPAYGSLEIAIHEGKLRLHWNEWKLVLKHYGGDIFQIVNDYPKLDGTLVPFGGDRRGVQKLQFLGMIFQRQP